MGSSKVSLGLPADMPQIEVEGFRAWLLKKREQNPYSERFLDLEPQKIWVLWDPEGE